MKRVSWISRDIEKSPATPRCSSKRSYDNVAYDVALLRTRYQPNSFRPRTDVHMQQLLQLMNKLATYYELKQL